MIVFKATICSFRQEWFPIVLDGYMQRADCEKCLSSDISGARLRSEKANELRVGQAARGPFLDSI